MPTFLMPAPLCADLGQGMRAPVAGMVTSVPFAFLAAARPSAALARIRLSI